MHEDGTSNALLLLLCKRKQIILTPKATIQRDKWALEKPMKLMKTALLGQQHLKPRLRRQKKNNVLCLSLLIYLVTPTKTMKRINQSINQ